MIDSNTMGPGMMGLSLVWMFVLFVGLIALVVWLVKAMFPQNGRGQNPQEQRADKGDYGEAGALETAW